MGQHVIFICIGLTRGLSQFALEPIIKGCGLYVYIYMYMHMDIYAYAYRYRHRYGYRYRYIAALILGGLRRDPPQAL